MRSGSRVARRERGAERARDPWCSCRRTIPTSRQTARSRSALVRRSQSCVELAGWSFGQLNESVSVDHGFETVDFVVGAVSRAIADSDQAQDAKRAVDRSPAIDDAAEQITPEQRRGGALRLDQGQEHLEAAVHAKPLGGENFALRKAADDAPKSWHGRGNCRNASFGQDRNGDIVASNPLPNGDARMPLSPEAQNILRALSEPIDQQRRWDFLD
jgi:hypothetical protein